MPEFPYYKTELPGTHDTHVVGWNGACDHEARSSAQLGSSMDTSASSSSSELAELYEASVRARLLLEIELEQMRAALHAHAPAQYERERAYTHEHGHEHAASGTPTTELPGSGLGGQSDKRWCARPSLTNDGQRNGRLNEQHDGQLDISDARSRSLPPTQPAHITDSASTASARVPAATSALSGSQANSAGARSAAAGSER